MSDKDTIESDVRSDYQPDTFGLWVVLAIFWLIAVFWWMIWRFFV